MGGKTGKNLDPEAPANSRLIKVCSQLKLKISELCGL